MRTEKRSKQPGSRLTKELPNTPDARKAQLDYMCTYMTWLTIKEQYTKDLSLSAS